MVMSSHCALRITLSVILVGITVDAVPVVQEKSAQLRLSESHVTDLSSQTPWVSVPAARGIVATQLAVVVNAADAQSVTVGTAYAAARHVPAANVVTLNFSTGSILSHDEFAKVGVHCIHARSSRTMHAMRKRMEPRTTVPRLDSQGLHATPIIESGAHVWLGVGDHERSQVSSQWFHVKNNEP
jgi:hypothetical protein